MSNLSTYPLSNRPFQVSQSSSGLCRAVTPSDTVALPDGPTVGISLGAAGTFSFVDMSGTTSNLPTLVAGVIHPIRALRVNTTNTAATGIFAWY